MITDFGKRVELLKPYGRTPSGVDCPLFGDEVNVIFHRIRNEYYGSELVDWLSYMVPEDLKQDSFLMTPEYLRGYLQFKYAVAKVINPKTIVEIGIGAGNSAFAFVKGAPESNYIGIDDNSKMKEQGIDYTGHVDRILSSMGVKHEFIIIDSMCLKTIPVERVNLFHVDGGHDYEHALNDCRIAFSKRPNFILIDDAHDTNVQRAAIRAFNETEAYKWTMFEDTFTGNLLFGKTGG